MNTPQGTPKKNMKIKQKLMETIQKTKRSSKSNKIQQRLPGAQASGDLGLRGARFQDPWAPGS